MPRNKFKRLGLLFIVALACIALSIITSQGLVQSYIGDQENDSRTINIAGRQRMLSQQLAKIILQIKSDPNHSKFLELDSTLNLWMKSHHGLLNGDEELGLEGDNSDDVRGLFEKIEPYYSSMIAGAKAIYQLEGSVKPEGKIFQKNVRKILDNEKAFVEGMDRIVFQYANEARAKIELLRKTEFVLFIISISIILIEFIFIFRPTAREVKVTVEDLTQSEKSSQEMAREMSKIYDELVKSYQDLEAVNIAPKESQVLANMRFDGTFRSSGSFLQKLIGVEKLPNFKQLLSSNGYSDPFIKGLMANLESGKNWLGELKLTDSNGDFCWLEVFLIPVLNKQEIKMIGKDVTEIKEAKMISREINREKVEKKVKEQQYRSVLILEGQEEERKRLAREMHDGIGQMLTALQLSIESITLPAKSHHNYRRIGDTKFLVKQVIKEIRRVSFNLTPTNLEDYGIVPAIRKFCAEVSKLSNKEVIFENKTSFINRLETHVENNLYRIIQEAVNNAIKYSTGSTILVIFEHSINSLRITVADDGKGFDYEELVSEGRFKSSGHGIFNMRERATFIDAVLNIKTAPGGGTKIIVDLSLD